MTEWRNINEMPVGGTLVEIETAKGIICHARARSKDKLVVRKADKYGPDRVYCTRVDEDGKAIGDVVAIKWR